MKRAGLVILGMVALAGVSLAVLYNRFVSMDIGVKAAWAQVENQLQRRNDLIPNLVETVKGYAAHEKDIFIQVADARAKLAGAGTVLEKVDAANGLNSALSRLLAIAENYPQLKADANFRDLQSQLEGTENRITIERQRMNEVTQRYNTYVRSFPSSIVAGMKGFVAKPYFQSAAGSDKAPEVKF